MCTRACLSTEWCESQNARQCVVVDGKRGSKPSIGEMDADRSRTRLPAAERRVSCTHLSASELMFEQTRLDNLGVICYYA